MRTRPPSGQTGQLCLLTRIVFRGHLFSVLFSFPKTTIATTTFICKWRSCTYLVGSWCQLNEIKYWKPLAQQWTHAKNSLHTHRRCCCLTKLPICAGVANPEMESRSSLLKEEANLRCRCRMNLWFPPFPTWTNTTDQSDKSPHLQSRPSSRLFPIPQPSCLSYLQLSSTLSQCLDRFATFIPQAFMGAASSPLGCLISISY